MEFERQTEFVIAFQTKREARRHFLCGPFEPKDLCKFPDLCRHTRQELGQEFRQILSFTHPSIVKPFHTPNHIKHEAIFFSMVTYDGIKTVITGQCTNEN